jgi:hypothetical protein
MAATCDQRDEEMPVRSLYFTAAESGLTRSQLRWGEHLGRWTKVARSTYRYGPEPPSVFDRAIALIVATDAPASGALAGVLHSLDGVELTKAEVTRDANGSHLRDGVRRRTIPPERIVTVAGLPCLDAVQTLVDLAMVLDDLKWEQALESALRKRLTTVAEVAEAAAAVEPGRAGPPGGSRVRRVLALRPPDAAPTESLLETLALQLARTVPGLGEPVRQFVVYDRYGNFVARVDLAWPELGLFIELDGMHHAGQPLYDARRETAVIAATGWLVARFTWDEIVRNPRATARRLAELAAQARRRPRSLPA